MPKRLIICADGTWNTEGEIKDGRPADTNVAKLAQAICARDASGDRQMVYYQPGVGTSGAADRVLGGVGGYGISRNICAGYRFLVNNYEDGDEIFLFGFSRGAYTVRSLAGLIRNCGLLHEYHGNQLQRAYALYRDRSDDTHPSSKRARAFRQRYSRQVEIKCLGVWDTVGSLGIPDALLGARLNPLLRREIEFHDVTLSSWVKHAFHAIAIDECRKAFTPTLWNAQGLAGQVLEQVWFPGVHADVGGGYANTSLSDIALRWMVRRAAGCGLAVDEAKLRLAPHPSGPMHNSLTWMFRPFGAQRRRILCDAKHFAPEPPDPHMVIDTSAFERLSDNATGYYPSNVLEFMEAHLPFNAAEEATPVPRRRLPPRRPQAPAWPQ
jgi:uncharacterized protein (DUF2235 family)